jgi:Tfp pilus assembly protein PilO
MMLIDNLSNLNRSTRTTVYAALIIIAAIAMYDWIVAPYVTCLSASQQYESVVDKAMEKNKAVAREVEDKTKKLDELHRQLDVSRSTLFVPDRAKALFSDLQSIAEGAGCAVSELNLIGNKPSSRNKRKTEDASGVAANSAEMTVSGQYSNILALVEELQNHPKKIWLDSFEMKIADVSTGRLECKMTITVYTIQDKGVAL